MHDRIKKSADVLFVAAVCLSLAACANYVDPTTGKATGYFSKQSLQADIDNLRTKLDALGAKLKADYAAVKAATPQIVAGAKAFLGIACALAPLVQQEAANVQGALDPSILKIVKPTLVVSQKGAATTVAGCSAYSKATVTNPATGNDTINTAIGLANGAAAAADALKAAKTNAGVS